MSTREVMSHMPLVSCIVGSALFHFSLFAITVMRLAHLYDNCTRNFESPVVVTCDGRLYVDHGLLGAQQRGAIVDDPQSGGLVYPALEDEVLLQHIWPRFARPRVEHLGRGELMAGRKRNA